MRHVEITLIISVHPTVTDAELSKAIRDTFENCDLIDIDKRDRVATVSKVEVNNPRA